MNLRGLFYIFSVCLLIGCQKDHQHFDLNVLDQSSVFDEDQPDTLTEVYAKELTSGLAIMSGKELISFVNPKLDQDTLKELEVEVRLHEDYLLSEDYYLCVNDSISGYEKEPNEAIPNGAVQLEKIISPIKVLKDLGATWEIEHKDEVGNRHIFWRIAYGTQAQTYWAKRGIIYASGKENYFIARYRNCPKIQEEILKVEIAKLEEEDKVVDEVPIDDDEVVLPKQSSGFLEYVCTKDSPLSAFNTVDDIETENLALKIPRGTQVVRVQGEEHEPYVSKRNGTNYIRVQVQPDPEDESLDKLEGQRYWVTEEYIKPFEKCSHAQTKVFNVCSKTSVPYFTDDESLAQFKSSGSFAPMAMVYRRYGEFFSKKIVLDYNGEEVVYVPVTDRLISNDIKWIKESIIPETCSLNTEAPIFYQSSVGQECEVVNNNNFPLQHPARLDFYEEPASFGATRGKGRLHGATDLYSYYPNVSNSNNKFGGTVESINRGEVTGIGTWKHTHYITVSSLAPVNVSWLYGEISLGKIRHGYALKHADQIGKTAKYVLRNPKYPAMLHLERYSTVLKNEKSYKGTGKYRRNKKLVNPSCYVEYMSKRKFNKIWEGE